MAYGIKIQTMFGLEEIQNTQFAVSLIDTIVIDNTAGGGFSGTYQLPPGYNNTNAVAWDDYYSLYININSTGLVTYGTQNVYYGEYGPQQAPVPQKIITIYLGAIT